MRTTLDIADDVLQAAKELARREGTTAGHVLSELARRALAHPGREVGAQEAPPSFLGFDPFPARGGIVTDDLVSSMREGEPD